MSGATLLSIAGEVLAEALFDEQCYIALGSGDSDWDSIPLTSPIPQPATSQTALLNEIARAAATVTYADANGVVSVPITRYLRFSASFGVGVANGTIREMALVRSNSGVIGSGKLISAINFRAIAKPSGGSDYILSRAIRLAMLG